MTISFRFGALLISASQQAFACILHPSVESGTWNDSDGSEYADAGEVVSYVAVVKNEGTVTLGTLAVVDVRAAMVCDEPESGLLGQGEEYQCIGSIQVTSTHSPRYLEPIPISFDDRTFSTSRISVLKHCSRSKYK